MSDWQSTGGDTGIWFDPTPEGQARSDAYEATNPAGQWKSPTPAYAGGAQVGTPTVATAPAAAGGTTTPPDDSLRQHSAIDFVKANFPWAESIGLTADITKWIQEGASPEGVVAQARQSAQYKARFVGIQRADGTLRMNEGAYLAQEDAYRTVLKQGGRSTTELTNPADYKALFDGEVDPNELKDRLDTYNQIDRAGDSIKSAFYVYAGMKLSTDDLYRAAVMPKEGDQLTAEYQRRVAAQPLDYSTWLTRATESGLDQVTSQLNRMRDAGYLGEQAATAMQNVDPSFARDMMQALHQGDGTGQFLSLDELHSAFQYAMLGSAAASNGLSLPGVDRLEALRQAGITRAKAMDAYGQIGADKNLWQGELSRAHLGPMDEADFEKAMLLNDGTTRDLLGRAQGYETSLGQQTGAASFSRQARTGTLQQAGLTATIV